MLENLKRQEAILPTINKVKTLEMLLQLQTLYFGDHEVLSKYYCCSDYWNELAGGQLTCCRDFVDEDASDANGGQQKNEGTYDKNINDDEHCNVPTKLDNKLLEIITTKGFHVLPAPSSPSSQHVGEEKHTQQKVISSTAFSNTLKALSSAGWPPQFLLMYDETWQLLRDTIHSIIVGQDDSCGWEDNVIVESDINVWSLKTNQAPGTYIGGNFIAPHRDMTFDACHDDNEVPTSLSVWIPLNPCGATKTNGCMRIIPIEHDDFFYSPLHPHHSMNSHYNNDGYDDDDDIITEKLIVKQFGCATWDPSCIHWGGSYEEKSDNDGNDDIIIEEPRSSLAFTIRVGRKAANFETFASRIPTDGNDIKDDDDKVEIRETGPLACTVREVGKGGVPRRLQVVAKSLLSYSHHFPGFPCDGFRENMGLSP